MALWQFVLDLVPSSAITSDGVIVNRMNRDRLDEIGLDFPRSTARAIQERVGAILPEGRWSTPSLRVWGDETSNDVQIGLNGPDVIEHVQVRLDTSDLSLPLVEKICTFARDFDCLFATDSGMIIRPDGDALVAAILVSDAARYVSNPAGYLREPLQQNPQPR